MKRINMPIPREHGAWAMLYTPFLVTSLTIGKFDGKAICLLIALTAMFFSHEAMALLARAKPDSRDANRRIHSAFGWLVVYLLLSVLASAPLILIYEMWMLLPLGILTVVLLLLHSFLIARKIERSLVGELLGVLSLTLSAPATYYVAHGYLDRISILLWILNSLYFISSIFYVKMLVSHFSKEGNVRQRKRQCGIYHALLTLSISILILDQWIPALTLLAFIPILLRSVWGMAADKFRLNLRRIGFAEVGLTLFFAIVIVITF